MGTWGMGWGKRRKSGRRRRGRSRRGGCGVWRGPWGLFSCGLGWGWIGGLTPLKRSVLLLSEAGRSAGERSGCLFIAGKVGCLLLGWRADVRCGFLPREMQSLSAAVIRGAGYRAVARHVGLFRIKTQAWQEHRIVRTCARYSNDMICPRQPALLHHHHGSTNSTPNLAIDFNVPS